MLEWWRIDNRDSEEPSRNIEESKLVSLDDEEKFLMEEEAKEDKWVLEVLVALAVSDQQREEEYGEK
jgi:hypothetical protein